MPGSNKKYAISKKEESSHIRRVTWDTSRKLYLIQHFLWPTVWLYISFFYISVAKILARSNIRGKITTLAHGFRRYRSTVVQRPQGVVQVMVREGAMEVVHTMADRKLRARLKPGVRYSPQRSTPNGLLPQIRPYLPRFPELSK